MEENQTKKSNKFLPYLITIIAILTVGISEYFIVQKYFCPATEEKIEQEDVAEKNPMGIMLMIEYKDTVGLSNMVNEIYSRNIPGLLLVSPDFVEQNCDEIREILKHNVEIIGSNPSGEFWDMPYEDQYEAVSDMKDKIEACTEKPLRIIGSRYMASDETTVQVAEELGIPYVVARGTTGTKATVYKPEEYDVKILSVSNIEIATFKYGSLCDYSFYERSGTPEDMLDELNLAIKPLEEKEIERYGEYHRVTTVSHTNIGGYLKPWLDMWKTFWNTSDVNWVSLDEFMENADWEIPMWQIPINKNAPYTPEKINPLYDYEDIEKVENPCAVIDLPEADDSSNTTVEESKIVMFHNGTGPMCLEAMEFLDEIDYPSEQHLNTDDDYAMEFTAYKSDFTESEGVSEDFGYYPIIFVGGRAFSGFNDEIKEEILEIIK